MLGGCSGDETDAKWKGGKRNGNGPVQLIARLDALCFLFTSVIYLSNTRPFVARLLQRTSAI